ncbi:MAG: PEGA domain-containing protein [Deltaproteobacteria bacterium]|nr:MAG: PEGA domain-containing protein [Deltaproteobacteria bacterium]
MHSGGPAATTPPPSVPAQGRTGSAAAPGQDDASGTASHVASPATPSGKPDPGGPPPAAEQKAASREGTRANAGRTRPRRRGRPGRLTVFSSGLARVYIDGRDIGRTTPLRDYPLKPGRHTVRLVSPTTGARARKVVYIQPNQPTRIQLKLR